jgi:L-asparagine transporter-like permease
LNRNEWVRQAHRWLSVAFAVAIVVNIVLNIVAREQKLTLWVGLLTLLPLALLLVTGLYLFVLPYTARWRRTHRR